MIGLAKEYQRQQLMPIENMKSQRLEFKLSLPPEVDIKWCTVDQNIIEGLLDLGGFRKLTITTDAPNEIPAGNRRSNPYQALLYKNGFNGSWDAQIFLNTTVLMEKMERDNDDVNWVGNWALEMDQAIKVSLRKLASDHYYSTSLISQIMSPFKFLNLSILSILTRRGRLISKL